jgi:thiamine-monophosphate kinase
MTTDSSSCTPGPSSEGEVIEIIATTLSAAGIPADLSDDCAHLSSPTQLVSTDTLVEGRHFDLALDTLEQVGAQAAVSSLSDLAASGGEAGWLLWSLCLPRTWTTSHIRQLTEGFARISATFNARIIGGNLSTTPEVAVINVCVGGPLAAKQPFRRDGAKPNDIVFLSGPVGNASLGVADSDSEARALRHRWRPHLPEARALAHWGKVTAAMDVSDGLLLDASRLADASGLAIEMESAQIPVSEFYRTRRGEDLSLALSGGEDYVLLFTAPPGEPPPIKAHAIGRLRTGAGVFVDNRPVDPAGYDHFDGGRSL